MPLDKDRLNQQLAQLEKYIKQLEQLRKKPEAEYTGNSDTEALAERRVYKAIQAGLDIASQINSSLGLGAPRFYRDLFVNLGDKGIIDRELQAKLEKIAGMRNVLAHEYAQVDPKQIYQAVQEGYKDLVEFAEKIAEFVNRQK